MKPLISLVFSNGLRNLKMTIDECVLKLYTDEAFADRERFMIEANRLREKFDISGDDIYFSALKQGLIHSLFDNAEERN